MSSFVRRGPSLYTHAMPPIASILLAAACGFASSATATCEPTPLQEERSTHLGLYLGTVDSLVRPVAVAFGPAGETPRALWVAEVGDAATPAGLRALDGVNQSLGGKTRTVRTLQRRGVGVLQTPSGIAVDGAGVVFATDIEAHALWQFDGTGAAVRLAGRGAALGEVLFPTDVDVLSDATGAARMLVVADSGNDRVQVYDMSTKTWSAVAPHGLRSPLAACFYRDARDPKAAVRIAACDGVHHCIRTVAVDGTDPGRFSDWGPFPSFVSTPSGISAMDGLLFVADQENHRVQAFDPNKKDALAYRFGIHAIRPGDGESTLHYPTGIAIEGDGAVLALVEPLDDRIQVFGRAEGAVPKEDPTRAGLGPPSAHFGRVASASGQFLATVSPESHRVQIHDLRNDRPVKIADLFGFGDRLGMMRGPAGVWLDDDGRSLIATDSGSSRLTRVTLKTKPEDTLKQQPDLAIFEDALRLDALDIPESMRPQRESAWVRTIPGPVCALEVDGARFIAVLDLANNAVLVLDDALSLVGVLAPAGIGTLTGITRSSHGTLLVGTTTPPTDEAARSGRVVELSLDGKLLRTLGVGVLTRPLGLTMRDRRLFASDPTRDRIEVFDWPEDDAEPILHAGGFGSRGLGRKEFHDPSALCVLGDGRLVVIDYGNHRGQTFDAEGNFSAGFGSRLYVAPLRVETK